MSRSPIVVGLGLLLGCPTSQSPIVELSGTGGTGGTTQGSETGAELCGPEEFDIMGHCYHRVDVPDILSFTAVVAGDFDGDEVTDIVATCDEDRTPAALCFFSVNGSVVKTELPWSVTYPSVNAADFDGDGRSDVLVSTQYQLGVFTFDGVSFQEHSQLRHDSDLVEPPDHFLYPAFPIDLDQDGKAEIVTGSGDFGFRVWRFDEVAVKWVPTGERMPLFGCGDLADARIADLDGDELPEFIAIGSHNNCDAGLSPGTGWNRVSVFTPNGVELVEAGDFASELAAERIEIADFDGDQIPDLLVAALENMMLFRGNGDRSFKTPIPIPGFAYFGYGSGPRAADFDLDGFSELLAPQKNEPYHILVGLPSPAIVPIPEHIRTVVLLEDIDDDGRPDFANFSIGSPDRYHLVLTLSGSTPPMKP